MLPPTLVAALAAHLKVATIIILYQKEPLDGDLALFKAITSESRQIGAKLLDTALLREQDDLSQSLLVDLHGEFKQVQGQSYFSSDIHWIVSDQTVSKPPKDLRFDSNFIVARLNQNGSMSLYDWYKVRTRHEELERKLISDYVGIWSIEDGLQFQTNKWDRRKLHGLTLKVTTVPNTRFVWDSNNDGIFTGVIVDILQGMEKMSNFSAQWIIPPDGAYGLQNPDGSWTGMVGLLEQGQVDMSAAMLSISLSRSQVISYAHSWLEMVTTLQVTDDTFRGPEGAVNFTGYLSVFTTYAWIGLLIILALEVASFIAFLNFSSDKKSRIFQLGKSCVIVGESLLNLSITESFRQTRISNKAIYWVAAMFPIVILSHYEGLLTSYLTVKVPPPKIKSIADILVTGHKLVLVKESVHLEGFEKAPPGTAKNLVYEARIRNNPKALVESPATMDDITASDPTTVSFSSLAKGDVSPQGLYGLKGLDEAVPDHLAFALQKESEYLELINHNMIQMYQSGVLEFIMSKWLGNRRPQSICSDYSDNHNARYRPFCKTLHIFMNSIYLSRSLGYDNMLLPSMVFLGGAIVALTLLVFEGMFLKLLGKTKN